MCQKCRSNLYHRLFEAHLIKCHSNSSLPASCGVQESKVQREFSHLSTSGALLHEFHVSDSSSILLLCHSIVDNFYNVQSHRRQAFLDVQTSLRTHQEVGVWKGDVNQMRRMSTNISRNPMSRTAQQRHHANRPGTRILCALHYQV